MCFGCRRTSCCRALVFGNDHCEHKKGCPFSLWVRRLNSFQEVVVVTELASQKMCETIHNLGSHHYECNLRLDLSTFNVNRRGGALFQGRGGVGGIKMETIIRYSNIVRFNVYFDENGQREPLRAMIERAGLGCCVHCVAIMLV